MSARTTARLALSAVVVALGVLAGASSALAGVTGHVGWANEGGTLCYGDSPRVIVRPPNVSSSAITNFSTYVSGGMFGGGMHVQRVSYQAYLYYWNASQRKWLRTQEPGPLYTGWAYDSSQPVVWDNNDMGGTTLWYVSRGYYYAVHFHVNWHADNLARGGTWYDWSASYEGLGAVADSYCYFP